MTTPVLTALVSTYASERHLRGCLDSLLAQTIGDRLEIVVIDACSPENEGAIVREYQGRHGIRYVRTEQREGTSQSLNPDFSLAELIGENEDSPAGAAVMYGAANWHYYTGQTEKAEEMLQSLVATDGWAGFGFIAAEADLALD